MKRFDPSEYTRAADARNFDRVLAAVAYGAATGPTDTVSARAEAVAARQAKSARWNTDVSGMVEWATSIFSRSERANVAGVKIESSWTAPAAQFVELARTESVVGRAPLRRLPFIRSSLEQLTASGANFVSEGSKVIPSRITAGDLALPPFKVAALAVCTREFALDAVENEDGAVVLSAELRRAVVAKLDSAFVAGAAVAGTRPAGIDVSASTVASAGATAANIADDLRKMLKVASEGGLPIASAFWLMSNTALAYLRLLRVADDSGTLAGLPAFGSDAARGKLLLVLGDFVAFAMAPEVALFASQEADIEMTDVAGMDSVTPQAATSLVGMFQTNSIAVQATLPVSWQVFGPESGGKDLAVVSLTGASYA